MHYKESIERDMIMRDVEGFARCVKVFGHKGTDFITIAKRTFEPMRYHISPLEGGRLVLAHAIPLRERYSGMDKLAIRGDFEISFHSNGTGNVYTIHGILPIDEELRTLLLTSEHKFKGIELWPEFHFQGDGNLRRSY